MINDRSAWEAFARAISVMGRPIVWLPMLAYAAIKLLLIGAYSISAGGSGSVFWSLLLGSTSRAELSHYPNNYYFLPVVLGRLDILFEVFVAVLFQAATVILFIHAIREERLSARSAIAVARGRYVPLAVVTLFAALALFLWFWIEQYLDRTISLPGPIGGVAFILGGIAIQALFVYALPIALLDDGSPFRALMDSFRTAIRQPFRALLIILIPLVVAGPALYVSKQTPFLVWRLAPEIVVSIQVFQEIVHWPSTVLMMGALAALSVRRKNP